MAELVYVQDYPKDNQAYRYAYISLRSSGGGLGFLLPAFNQLVYQVIDEDSAESIYDSNIFKGGWASATGISAYNQTVNYMTQHEWQRDGEVYCELKRDYLSRYRKSKY